MKTGRQSKFFFIGFSMIVLLGLGLVSVSKLPSIQVKASQALTWVHGALHPKGSLPTAETGDTKAAAQTPFWLPDVMGTQTESGGATEVVQTKQASTPLPAATILPVPAFDPKHDYQDWNNCGPATLALALRYWGWLGDQFTISEVIRPKRQDKNVNIDELAGYVNASAAGLQAEVRVGGSQALLERLIAGGYPVVIEESFRVEKPAWPGDDQWAGHYLLLTGYDEQSQFFTAQDSYYGPDRLTPFTDLEKNWQAFNHVYLVIFPKSDLQKVQTLLAADWPTDANLTRTAAALQGQLQFDPGNAFAWFNLGSTLTAERDYASSALAFDRARALGLPSRMLRYQFGPFIAAYQTGNQKDLARLADYALQVTPDSEEALLWKGWAYDLAGDHLNAIALFNQALQAHPNYVEAEKALAIVRP